MGPAVRPSFEDFDQWAFVIGRRHRARHAAGDKRAKRHPREKTRAQRPEPRSPNARNGREVGVSKNRLSAAGFGGLVGGRTRARTWDPLIKSLISCKELQTLSCKVPLRHGYIELQN